MNVSVRVISGTMPLFSTDPTALRVNCFIARRAAFTSRPATGGEHGPSGASAPLEVLYPSLYAQRNTPPARWRVNVRAAAAVFARTILGRHCGGAVPSDEMLLDS